MCLFYDYHKLNIIIIIFKCYRNRFCHPQRVHAKHKDCKHLKNQRVRSKMGAEESFLIPQGSVDDYPLATITFKTKPFAEGNSRRAYMGTYDGDDRLKGKQCVVKVYKDHYNEELKQHAWKADDRAYTKATEMAELFNARHQTNRPIVFCKPEFARVKANDATIKSILKMPPSAKVAIERYLEGKFEKFNSNRGFVHAKQMASPGAFSHFSYIESNKEFLICDLQGVRTNSAYMLTDPAVCSCVQPFGAYGPTDLGIFGVQKFFKKHVCNDLCSGLDKPKFEKLTPDVQKTIDDVNAVMQSDNAETDNTYRLSSEARIPIEVMEKAHNEAIQIVI
ncbi:alpha-protein kinase vwkA-like [Acanthaster planci]|uniref:Alpha-protein kinase vwkA-like n=1 Tax=Acanthaster planci TaxID=133434 RepID=A0A8B7YW59_ACAPL|nr:alpha-protein kinase vwkA-like [Acanthaster planci]